MVGRIVLLRLEILANMILVGGGKDSSATINFNLRQKAKYSTYIFQYGMNRSSHVRYWGVFGSNVPRLQLLMLPLLLVILLDYEKKLTPCVKIYEELAETPIDMDDTATQVLDGGFGFGKGV